MHVRVRVRVHVHMRIRVHVCVHVRVRVGVRLHVCVRVSVRFCECVVCCVKVNKFLPIDGSEALRCRIPLVWLIGPGTKPKLPCRAQTAKMWNSFVCKKGTLC